MRKCQFRVLACELQRPRPRCIKELNEETRIVGLIHLKPRVIKVPRSALWSHNDPRSKIAASTLPSHLSWDFHFGRPGRHRYTPSAFRVGRMCSWPILQAPDTVSGVYIEVELTGSDLVLGHFSDTSPCLCSFFVRPDLERPPHISPSARASVAG